MYTSSHTRERGHRLYAGALDQGRNSERFDFLRARGIPLHPQDGSGVRRDGQILVTSAAVEETVPDVQAARRIGAAIITRARLLA
jgi:UDP-N-acetylmuramate--alanine ligase